MDFSGFKDLKDHLLNQYYYKKEKNLKEDFYDNLFSDLKLTHNIIDQDLIAKIASQLCENNNKIIIFATGKTKIIASYFYFTLLEYGFNVEMVSSLYAEKGFETNNAIIFALSISGNNSKIDRYLNIINQFKKYKMIVGVTSTPNFISKNNVNFHIYGNIRKYFSSDQRANPFVEKYVLMYLIDNILLNIFEKLKYDNKVVFGNSKSKNFI
ncbi:hypothetical protein SCLARK_00245 [Spiroplasma clarkii]|uniref:SIS domain-containing protein n=1 Tax=Spiroplasma clarkii TaxID=2139 RepID=UPI000B54B97E|nr:SIS domain-containing protein [Spiroplasma clarkii]ARU91005.1 hypothetical protein SCLARK_00245 [Spiroplasma clarkii]